MTILVLKMREAMLRPLASATMPPAAAAGGRGEAAARGSAAAIWGWQWQGMKPDHLATSEHLLLIAGQSEDMAEDQVVVAAGAHTHASVQDFAEASALGTSEACCMGVPRQHSAQQKLEVPASAQPSAWCSHGQHSLLQVTGSRDPRLAASAPPLAANCGSPVSGSRAAPTPQA